MPLRPEKSKWWSELQRWSHRHARRIKRQDSLNYYPRIACKQNNPLLLLKARTTINDWSFTEKDHRCHGFVIFGASDVSSQKEDKEAEEIGRPSKLT